MVYGRKVRTFDWFSFSIFLSLVIIGWLMVYASASEQDTQEVTGSGVPLALAAQGVWVMIAVIAFLTAYLIDTKFWTTFAYPIFIFTLLLLLLVLIFGVKIKGATSWFQIAGFSLQPSEFAKVGTALAISAYLSHYKTNLRDFKYQVTALGMIAAPVFLIMLQPDAGSALVFLSLMLLLFREGMPPAIYIIGLLSLALFITSLLLPFTHVVFGVLAAGLAIIWGSLANIRFRWPVIGALGLLTVLVFFMGWITQGIIAAAVLSGILFVFHGLQRNGRFIVTMFPAIALSILFAFSSQYVFNNVLKPHQQDRINVWLQPEKCDPRGSLYNVLQSKVAIGSGGLQGKGFLQGTMTKLNYVPEQSTDFIFSTIGEEQGFIGSLGIIGLFLILILRIIWIGEKSTNRLYRNFAYTLAGFLFIHTFVNIGMTMGLVPIVGIPLPLISKGGSSLLGFSIMMGILLRMDNSGR